MSFLSYINESFLKSRDMQMLPERVQASLYERERNNEIVARVIQLSIVLMFALLYSLATKTGTKAVFQPVPFVLGAYFILSVIGLAWSMKTTIPTWAVYCSILFDFTLLYTLIISFHHQYEQPASFILKAPTLLYVFIFIALRALRFDWKFVAAAGLAAAVGWIAIVLYVINVEPEDTMITRSYVEYLTSNTILIGAEIDKVISILAVTALLALFVNSSSNLLVTAVSEQAAANDFSRFFDRKIAEDIRSGSRALEAGIGERRVLTILNIDIRGFSKLAEGRDASQVMRMLSAYQGRVVPLLQSHGAVIDKFMGDGIMATIGMNTDSQSICRCAVEAAEAVLQDSGKWQEEEPLIAAAGPIRIGIGIAHGPVSFGAVGRNERLEMTVIGTAVNTAAKLEKHNKVLHTECIVQQCVWEGAISEGYSGKFSAQFLESEIEGIEKPQQIAILSF